MATFWPATNPASFRPCSNAVARCSEPAAVVLRRKPITGTADCWARAASGHDAAVLLRSLMNSRRLTGFTPSAENHLKSNTVFDRAPCTDAPQSTILSAKPTSDGNPKDIDDVYHSQIQHQCRF